MALEGQPTGPIEAVIVDWAGTCPSEKLHPRRSGRRPRQDTWHNGQPAAGADNLRRNDRCLTTLERLGLAESARRHADVCVMKTADHRNGDQFRGLGSRKTRTPLPYMPSLSRNS